MNFVKFNESYFYFLKFDGFTGFTHLPRGFMPGGYWFYRFYNAARKSARACKVYAEGPSLGHCFAKLLRKRAYKPARQLNPYKSSSTPPTYFIGLTNLIFPVFLQSLHTFDLVYRRPPKP